MLQINNISKSYSKQRVLTDINLSIDKPRLIALIAPNGSGKTTLLNIICNLEKADSGTIKVNGLPNSEVEIFEELTFLQDNSVLYDDLTGMDHIQLIQDIHSVDKEKVDSALMDLKMEDYVNKKVKLYSLGMKQHLLFALSILPNPKILLMDEPLNGLDPASVVNVRNKLLTLYKAGTTILFSSHNLDQIDKLTDDIFFLKESRLISYDDIKANQAIKVFELILNQPRLLMSLFDELEILSEFKCRIKCSLDEYKQLKNNENIIIYESREIVTTLEELYFELYEDYNYETIQI